MYHQAKVNLQKLNLNSIGAGLQIFFLAAPAPSFFPSGSASGSWYFLKQLRLQGAKNMRLLVASAPALDFCLSLAKYFSPHKLLEI